MSEHAGSYRVALPFSDGERSYTFGDLIDHAVVDTWPNKKAMINCRMIVRNDDGATDYLVKKLIRDGAVAHWPGDVIPREVASEWRNLRFLLHHGYLEPHKQPQPEQPRKRGRPPKEFAA